MLITFVRWSLAFALWVAGFATAQVRPFEDTLAQRLLACTSCHGDQGRAGPDGYYPRLAGKPAGYLSNQLQHFQEGRRHYTPMLNLIKPLSEDYLRDIAEHFAAQSPPYAAPPASNVPQALLNRGQVLAKEGDKALGIPACTQCHGLALTGVLPETPGLLGLPRDYLNAQLGGWQTGQRKAHAPDCMALVANKLSAEDANAVASWLASRSVPKDAKPATARPAWPSGSKELRCGTGLKKPQATPASTDNSRGAYLARIGNCAACHTAPGGALLAGGRGIETPFGTVFSSNLTSDAVTGLGQWSANDFWQAMHKGQSRDGRWLNPAFPYTSYTHISREDSDAIFSYLKSLPAVPNPPKAHQLTWPLGTQAALGAWRALYFKPGSPPTERGAYLAKGLGHCAECHTQRNILGGLDTSIAPKGAVLPGSKWYAPSLYRSDEAGVMQWPLPDIVRFLTTGVSGNAVAAGPMAEVVQHGTRHLSTADAQALAAYLKGLPDLTAPVAARSATQPALNIGTAMTFGSTIYTNKCADCHGERGEGRAGIYPALAGNRAVSAANINNLLLTLLHGGFAPATPGNPQPYGMPGFLLTLKEKELAAVLTYIRASWGNSGAVVNEFDINKLRTSSGR